MSSGNILGAIHFAAIKHKNQRRKNAAADPYINHPLEVAFLLSEAGVTDQETLMAAVLHDTIEDTQTSYEELVNEFGTKVAKIVMEVSDDKSLPKIKRKKLQIIHASDISEEAKLVKLGDKYSNCRDLLSNPPKCWTKEEIDGYAIWCYAVFQKLKGVNSWFHQKFEELFTKFGISSKNLDPENLDSLLEKYYSVIKNSE